MLTNMGTPCMAKLKSVLGDEFTCGRAGCSIRFQDTACTSSSRLSNLASSLGAILSSSSASQRFTPMAIRSPYEKYEQRFPGGIAALRRCSTLSRRRFRRWNSGHWSRTLVSVDRFLMIFVRANQSLTRPTMPRNSRRTMLSSWKGMCAGRFSTSVTVLLTSVVAEAYGPNFFSYITRNSTDREMRKKYRIISAEGYPLYDSTLREPFIASYILACLEKTLQSTEGQGKDFKSSFARKAKSDLIAYERLTEKRKAECDLLRTSPSKSSWNNSPNLRLRRLWSRSRWILPAHQKRTPTLRWIPLVRCRSRNRGLTSG